MEDVGFSKRQYIVALGAIGVGVVVGSWWFVAHSSNDFENTYTVTEQPLTRLVSFTGTVVPAQQVDLAFERSGRATNVSVDVGDTVQRNDTLAVIASTDVLASLNRERANLAAEEARLDALVRGAREEELNVLRAQLASARATEVEAREALITALESAYATADAALYETADQIFDTPRTLPRLKYHSSDNALDNALESSRLAMEKLLTEWRADTQTLLEAAGRNSSSLSNTAQNPSFTARMVAAAATSLTQNPSLAQRVQTARDNLLSIKVFFDTGVSYVNALFIQSSLTQATIDTWEAAFTTERAALLTERAALNTVYKTYTAAQSAVAVAEAELALQEAGATEEDLREQEAAVAAANARVSEAADELSKYILRAPFAGTVTDRAIEPGELATAGVTALSLESNGAYEVDARVSELDVIALRAGQQAEVTFDAYETNDTATAVVSHVDPSETTKNNIAGYGVTLTFTQENELLRAGMTVNVLVRIVERERALAVPSGYISRTDDTAMVQLLEKNTLREVPVQIGTIVPGGLIEIVSGITSGDTLVPYAGL